MVAADAWGVETGELLFNEYRVSVLQDENGSGDGGGGVGTTARTS